jgi:hypothetical protein
LLFLTLAFSAWVITRVIVLEPPPVVLDTLNDVIGRISRRFAAS